MSPLEPGTNTAPSPERIKAIRTPGFRQSWGPSYFAAKRFPEPKSVDEFIVHMNGLLPSLDTWKNEIKDRTIDEGNMKATVLLYIYMIVKGNAEVHLRTVRMDVVWMLKFAKGGKLVEMATEFVDAGASEAIKN